MELCEMKRAFLASKRPLQCPTVYLLIKNISHSASGPLHPLPFSGLMATTRTETDSQPGEESERAIFTT
jgi:hypothetical protein